MWIFIDFFHNFHQMSQLMKAKLVKFYQKHTSYTYELPKFIILKIPDCKINLIITKPIMFLLWKNISTNFIHSFPITFHLEFANMDYIKCTYLAVSYNYFRFFFRISSILCETYMYIHILQSIDGRFFFSIQNFLGYKNAVI